MVKESLTIVSYNIGLGGRKIEEIATNFRRHRGLALADIVCLQEASGGYKLDAQVIAEALGPEYKYTNVESQKIFGLMQASAFVYNSKHLKPIAVESMELPFPPFWYYPVYFLLSAKIKFSRRACLIQTFGFRGKTIRLANVHLELGGGWRLKKKQLNSVLDRLNQMEHVDIEIICGDLNAVNIVPDRFSRRRHFLAAIHRLFERHGFKDISTRIGWTFSLRDINPQHRLFLFFKAIRKLGIKYLMYRKLDFMFVRDSGKKFRVGDAVSYDVNGSDHIPIAVKITPL